MTVETQQVTMPTYVRYNDLTFIYSGDRESPEDYDVTSHLHPFDGQVYEYLPDIKNWKLNESFLAEKIRKERNQLLQESDWTQGKDIPENISTPWANYRQQLRDITNQSTFPTSVTWPEKPMV